MSQTIEQLVEKYVAIRDTHAKLKKQFAERLNPLTEAMAEVEGVLLRMFQDMGMDSAKTAAGTAYKTTRVKASVQDWDSLLPFIQQNNLWAFLEKRVSKEAVQQYRDEYGDLPPGVTWDEEVVVNVRRS